MEALSFFCINYIYGLKLPAGAGAFPEVITVQQRRRTSVTLTGFFCHTIILLLCQLLCIFHKGVQRLDHFLCPAQGMQNFPMMLILQMLINAQSVYSTVFLRTLCSFIPTGMLAQIMQLFISIVFISYPGLSLVC